MIQTRFLEKLYQPLTRYTQGYGSLESIDSKIVIRYIKNGQVQKREINLDQVENPEEKIKKEIQKLLLHHRHKLIATSFTEKEIYKTLSPKLWLDEDIVSFLAKDKLGKEILQVDENIKTIASNFDKNNIALIHVTQDREVKVKDLISLDDYKKSCSSEEFSTLLSLVNQFKNKRVIFVSSTPQGGGVAIMRHALIRLLTLLDADVHWYVLKPNLDVFNITKRKFHNILQAAADSKTELNEDDKKMYNAWIKRNADFFKDKFNSADTIVIDDPQPSGLIPYIKKFNPKTKIIYRSHIHMETGLMEKKGTPQYKTWQFLWESIRYADLFVAHPVASFVPKEVPKNKVVFMPATTDPLDGLNKPLGKHCLDYYLSLFDKFLKAENQTPLDRKRPYLIQIARFDPSKGIPHVLKSYLKLTQMLKRKNLKTPQLVITGNGSIDDPDRSLIFDMTMKIINSSAYMHLKNDIKVARLPHIDQLFNTLLRRSKIVLQLSTKEGFEIKVTEALMKKKPVVAYKTGGIPLQIKDGINGFLVNTGNTDQVAKHLFNLMTDNVIYSRMSKAAEDYYDKSLLTIPGAIRWFKLFIPLTQKNN